MRQLTTEQNQIMSNFKTRRKQNVTVKKGSIGNAVSVIKPKLVFR